MLYVEFIGLDHVQVISSYDMNLYDALLCILEMRIDVFDERLNNFGLDLHDAWRRSNTPHVSYLYFRCLIRVVLTKIHVLTQVARHSLLGPRFRMTFLSQGTSCIGCNHRTFGAQ